MLRSQTQRRIDKELIGRELLGTDADYNEPRPEDWSQFISHGGLPSKFGAFDWERLTGLHDDFSNLGAALGALEYHPVNPGLPLNDPRNLHQLPARVIVIKKNPARLRKLVENLKAIRTKVEYIPTLVIDDESDQAGLNTIRSGTGEGDRERTSTNEAIVDLLRLLPRSQYIGYTATPYANALVNPNDPEDLFPKDFIVSLSRPEGYMGISDFFDPELDSEDLREGDFTQNENAFVRNGGESVQGSLEDAVASFILAGAVKLYRQSVDPNIYRFEHHTMLVHTGAAKVQHAADRAQIQQIFDQQAYSSPRGMGLLRKLWENDYQQVCVAQAGSDVCPPSFDKLRGPIGDCLNRLMSGTAVWVLNSDNDIAPDFNHEEVWAIFVGGNKLSRGYTIEGLTISYYTRPTKQADTLMQMGRWFGFRKGYRDLVRIFIGRSEGRNSVDLVDWFKQACLLEERFRTDVKRYSEDKEHPLRPIDIPPLIEVTGDLMPTARNKMWNAVLQKKNFGDRISTPTLAPFGEAMHYNDTIARALWDKLGNKTGIVDLGGDECRIAAKSGICPLSEIVKFLRQYKWLDDSQPTEIRLFIEFLENEAHGIKDFVVIAPQRGTPFGSSWYDELTVKKRKRRETQSKVFRGFQLYGEPNHRKLGRTIAGQTANAGPKIVVPNEETRKLMASGRGVVLLYPVRETENKGVSIGFEILVPPNDLPYGIQYTTRVNNDVAIIEAGDAG